MPKAWTLLRSHNQTSPPDLKHSVATFLNASASNVAFGMSGSPAGRLPSAVDCRVLLRAVHSLGTFLIEFGPACVETFDFGLRSLKRVVPLMEGFRAGSDSRIVRCRLTARDGFLGLENLLLDLVPLLLFAVGQRFPFGRILHRAGKCSRR